MADLDLDGILGSVEGRVHEITEDELERQLSVNEWIQRVRGAATEAHMYARTGQVGLEERSWIELAAIACRRIQTIRALEASGEHA